MTSSRFFPLSLLFILVALAALSHCLKWPFGHQNEHVHIEQSEQDIRKPAIASPKQKTLVVEHVTVLTVVRIPTPEEHPGLEDEESRLMQTLQKSKGKWDSTHPRYRLLTALKAYLLYKPRSAADIDKWRNSYKKIPKKQRSLVESKIRYSKKLNTVDHLILKNAEIAHAIVNHGLDFYEIDMKELEDFVDETQDEPTGDSKTNVLQAMKHFVRDWSEEGLHERQPTFPCIVNAIQREFPVETRTENAAPIKVLVPGAGLGRLAHEIAALEGFEVTANEWSSYMNLAYRYLLTLTTLNSATLHPFVDWWSHRTTTTSLTRSITFPDTLPSDTRSPVLLVEGDFTTVLTPSAGTFDTVLTLFFIDTAKNILSYLETIHAMLKPGGVWINFGPLLYGTNPSLQLSLDEVFALAEGLGFVFEEASAECGDVTVEGLKTRGKEVPYGSDKESLARNAYLAQHWVARKK
ncbi:hypothetical protein GTA08_BOTSDO12274 [Botryosphaeria dothidea]|uniref:N2227-domain-containing protein n=1 Tax=Botryosphaeria dothidea TaxID=55169 RepID=A0A8H4J3D2_9PEZI|nr:hypothetical protein GTA08_BOTSDO12274 [Botryosphaeria dothidea]